MKKILNIFRLTNEEWWPAVVAIVYVAALQFLGVRYGFMRFGGVTDDIHQQLIAHFQVSGFDAWSYEILTRWFPAYDIYRHPLIAFFLYPMYWVNEGLRWLVGSNVCMFLMGALNGLSGFYALVFLRRLLREVLGLTALDSNLLTLLFMSFGYVMLTICVPDHFCLSMMLLLLTLWRSGKLMKEGRQMGVGETVWLFVFTAGVSLNNGLKTFLAALFVNGKRFFRPRYLLGAVIVPTLLLGGIAMAEYGWFELPRVEARKLLADKARATHKEQLRSAIWDTISVRDSQLVEKQLRKELRREAHEQYRRNHGKTGIPFKNTGLLSWTNKSTDRGEAFVENFIGESVVFHKAWLLGDVLRDRPEIVTYSSAVPYIIIGVLLVLSLAGVWQGRRERFMGLLLSFLGSDLVLHLWLGFGISEVYIMAGHWIFFLPLSMAFLLRGKALRGVCRGLVALLALGLLVYNGWLLQGYLLM
ncbi:DUF6080 domain-containing protein [Prevotella sp.]|uniref:DUF6080 domain-containing protein n=1 Tax=Prevotella sp. TaxID=59823 RepID=UPI002F9460ED